MLSANPILRSLPFAAGLLLVCVPILVAESDETPAVIQAEKYENLQAAFDAVPRNGRSRGSPSRTIRYRATARPVLRRNACDRSGSGNVPREHEPGGQADTDSSPNRY